MNIQQMIRLGSLFAIGGLSVTAVAAGGCGGSTAASPSGATGGGGGATVDAGGNDAKKDAGGTGGAKADGGGELSGDYGINACSGVTSMKPAGLDSLPTCNDICGNAHCVPSSIPGANS